MVKQKSEINEMINDVLQHLKEQMSLYRNYPYEFYYAHSICDSFGYLFDEHPLSSRCIDKLYKYYLSLGESPKINLFECNLWWHKSKEERSSLTVEEFLKPRIEFLKSFLKNKA